MFLRVRVEKLNLLLRGPSSIDVPRELDRLKIERSLTSIE